MFPSCGLPFETEIIERYQRRESSVEEALIEMYLAGVSVRRVEDITEALWGMRVSPSTVSDLNQKMYGRIEAWRNAADRRRTSPTCTWTASGSSGAGAARSGTWRYWWRSGWTQEGYPGHSGRGRGHQGGHRELARLPARISRARPKGREAVRLATNALGWWRRWASFTLRPRGSGAWCISIATC